MDATDQDQPSAAAAEDKIAAANETVVRALARLLNETGLTEIEIERNWPAAHRNGSRGNARREAWLLFERKMLAEMRAADSGRLDEFGRPHGRVITVGQLAHWLSLRKREMARHRGAASNGIRVELTAWTDEP